jgi:hypothetical protein
MIIYYRLNTFSKPWVPDILAFKELDFKNAATYLCVVGDAYYCGSRLD